MKTSPFPRISNCAKAAALFLPLVLTGCSLFPTTRKLPVPKAPVIEQYISPASRRVCAWWAR